MKNNRAVKWMAWAVVGTGLAWLGTVAGGCVGFGELALGGCGDPCEEKTGAGGTGGTGPCASDADCDSRDDNPCTTPKCSPNGTCSEPPDDSAKPESDGNPCTDDACHEGQPVYTNNAAGCGKNPPKTHCVDGECLGCDTFLDCDDKTECQVWACVNSPSGKKCQSSNGPTDKFLDPDGDCKTWSCSDKGAFVSTMNTMDVPDDGKDCTADTCSAGGTPGHSNMAADTMCESGAKVCDGNGACIECNSTDQCQQPLNACTKSVCDTNQCVVQNVASNVSCDNGNGLCSGTGKCNHNLGFPCGTDSALCASGYCADGVCCDSKCDGNCQSCWLGSKGTCIDVTRHVAAKCTGTEICEPAMGTLKCLTPNPVVAPVGGSCQGDVDCATSNCSASNTCEKGLDARCAQAAGEGTDWICETNRCVFDGMNFTCSSCSLPADCAGIGAACASGSCALGAGVSCGVDADCASGYCADGVCCDSACTGPCQHCALPSSLGICSNVPAGINLDNDCASGKVCNGAGSCQ